VAIEVRSHSILSTWPNGCAESRGIALDEERGFLFAGCAEGKAVTLDANHGGKQLSHLVTGSGVDIVAYSPFMKHLDVPGASSATLTIAAVSHTGELRAIATVPTVSGAHCVAADDRGGIWVCDPQHGQLLFSSRRGKKIDRCGARMKLRALVISAASIKRLLGHFGEPVLAPVLSLARGPPFSRLAPSAACSASSR
jgi:hypothetical protein